MFQPDFGGHFYRFLVSTGLAFIALAFSLPWLIFRQTTVLLTPNSEVTQLTTRGQDAVHKMQDEQYWWLRNYRIFFVALILLGLALAIWGFIGWHRRQLIVNAKENAEKDTAVHAALQLNPDESAEEARQEALSLVDETRIETSTQLEAAPNDRLPGEVEVGNLDADRAAVLAIQQRIMQAEAWVGQLMSKAFWETHRALGEVFVQVAGRPKSTIDFMMEPRVQPDVVYLVEVKFYRRLLGSTQLSVPLSYLKGAVDSLSSEGASARGVLVAVVANDAETPVELGTSLLRWWTERNPENSLALILIGETALRNISADSIRIDLENQWDRGGSPSFHYSPPAVIPELT